MENRDKEVFEFSYSAAQREEIQKIRSKYAPAEPDKMQRLRSLDEKVNRKATGVSIIVGLVGMMLLGLGMTCCLEWSETFFVPGIFIGIAGLAGMSVAPPVHNYVLKKERQKIAPEVIKLTDELLK